MFHKIALRLLNQEFETLSMSVHVPVLHLEYQKNVDDQIEDHETR